MKKNIILFGVLAILATGACSNNNDKKESVDTPTPPAPAPAPEKTTIVVDSGQKEGTTIKVNDQGVSIENKDGSKKNNVKISKDSANIEITRPK